jgi:hypothetical protein
LSHDFFISYTAEDRTWAEWIAWELEQAKYSTVIQAWDFRPGQDWAQHMHEALQSAERLVAVLSPQYLTSQYGEAEWRAAFVKDPTGKLGLLVPVRIAEMSPPGLLQTRIYIDLVGTDETTARRRLLDGVRNELRAKPPDRPSFPAATSTSATVLEGGRQPPFPGPRIAPNISLQLIESTPRKKTFLLQLSTMDHALSISTTPTDIGESWLRVKVDGKGMARSRLISPSITRPLTVVGAATIFVDDGPRKVPITFEIKATPLKIQSFRVRTADRVLSEG